MLSSAIAALIVVWADPVVVSERERELIGAGLLSSNEVAAADVVIISTVSTTFPPDAAAEARLSSSMIGNAEGGE